MITINRSLAREVRAIFKRTLNVRSRRPSPPVTFYAGPSGLRIRAAWSGAAAEYHFMGCLPSEQITVPLDVLAQCEGKRDEEVRLERAGDEVAIRWDDDGIPQLVQCEAVEAAEFPDLAGDQPSVCSNPPEMLSALADAMDTTDRESTRYAVDKVQLQGQTGNIIATDGRQLLVQQGFEVPFEDNLLIPRTTVFQSRELPQDQAVAIFKSGKWINFRIGLWTLSFAADFESRFPKVEDHFPDPSDSKSRLYLDESDAQFLIKSLRRLPVSDKTTRPVTVELNGQVVVRAQSESIAKPTELVLKRATSRGEDVRINTNRTMLSRALAMGFRDFHLFGAESPVLCQDQRRSYLWALLSSQAAIQPHPEAVRIESPSVPVPTKCQTQRKRRSPNAMTTNHKPAAKAVSTNREAKTGHPSVEDLIDQAEFLRSVLRETTSKASELITDLKRHRKQSRLFKNTLASLKQLQGLEV